MIPVITIDGPSGSGKGTICRHVAKAKGYHLLDSGALYRLTALASIRSHCDIDAELEVAAVAEQLDVEFFAENDTTVILLAGQDVSQTIREEQVGMTASKIAAYSTVREALLARQRAFAKAPGLVADGRDMGTVVFKDAPVKIFLTASAQERARRRVKQLEQAGLCEIHYEKILHDIEQRDEQDRSRATAPLVPAKDAQLIDSTALSIDEVVTRVLAYANA